MSTVAGYDFEAVLQRIGRMWVWILAFGIISIVTGLLAVFWPGATLVAIAIVFAVQMILGAVYRFMGAFAIPSESGWLRALQALLAVLSFVVGVYLLGHVGLTLLVLAVLLGVYWAMHGVIELFVAFGHPELPGRIWMILSGVLSVVAGTIAVVSPGISLFVLTLVLGVWLVLFGAGLVARALQVRSALHGAASGALTPSST